MIKSIFFIVLYALSHTITAQGYLLIITNQDCQVVIDGEITEQLEKNLPKKITLLDGEHLIQGKTSTNELHEVVTIENEKQKILKLTFPTAEKHILPDESHQKNPKNENEHFLLVAELNLSLSGNVNALAEENLEFDNYSELYYAFERGDIIQLDASMQNKKGKFFIQVVSYPDLTPIFSKQKIEDIRNQRFTVRKKGIYILRIGTTAFFDKRIKFIVKRKPVTKESRDFNTQVIRKVRYNPVKILEPSSFYLNSTTHEIFKGGTNEIALAISTPPNTVEWYYIISASRDKEELDANLKKFSLLGDLAKVFGGAEPTTAAISIGIDLINQPPGSNYCDVYFFDYQNHSLFLNDNENFRYLIAASRENVKSAKVKIAGSLDKEYYLGLQNRDMRWC